jgi:hypothetical protein
MRRAKANRGRGVELKEAGRLQAIQGLKMKKRQNNPGALNNTKLSYFFAACMKPINPKPARSTAWVSGSGTGVSRCIPITGISDDLPSIVNALGVR